MLEGDEYEDHLIGDPNQLDDLIEGRDLENDHENVSVGAGSDHGSGDERKEKKTVKRVLNPQPKLDANRLTGPKGIVAIEGLFKDFEFRGTGYEDHDLNRIMKRLELWGNRLFPKLQFDDLLEKVEKLGHKRPVLNFVSKVRMGLVDEETVAENSKENGDIMDVDSDSVNNNDDVFEQLLSEQQIQLSVQPVQSSHPPPDKEITEEQKERMMRNRKIAEERRLARIKAQQERELQTSENNSAQRITIEAEYDRFADSEREDISKSHSVQFGDGQENLEVSSIRITEKEGELEIDNSIENIAMDPAKQGFDKRLDKNQPKVNNFEKMEVMESLSNESKNGEVDGKISRATNANFGEFINTSVDVIEYSVGDRINHHTDISNANI